jgi:hypothetical protein
MTPDDPLTSPTEPDLGDWTSGGVFRAAFIQLFPPEDRPLLRRAGVVLALQALSGETHEEPLVISELRAAAEDARMLAVYLEDIHQKAQDPLPTERAERLAARAQEWSREAAALAEAIERALTEDQEEEET